MNRVEFMSRLEELLAEIPACERQESITYYNDYFNDAGVENEQEVIESLMSPERVADTIKAGLGGKVIEGEFTETGYHCETEKEKEEIVSIKHSDERKTEKPNYSKQNPNENKVLKIILYVLIAVLLSPLWLPFVGAAFGILVAIFTVVAVAIFCVALIPVVVIIVGVVCFISGIFVCIVGLIKMFTVPAAAVGVIGIGFLLAGFGSLLTAIGAFVMAKAVPPAVRGFVNLLRMPFTRRRNK